MLPLKVPSASSPVSMLSKMVLTRGFIASGVGVLLLIITPYLHFGIAYSFWNVDKEPVNTKKCTCNCWDTYFKGSYEKRTPGYKHMYFNITPQMFKIWTITILWLIAAYEVTKHLVILFTKARIRYSMCLLFASVLYSHYYTWWGYVNAYNDDFYQQWYHQALFSITELISTVAVVHFCDKENAVKPRLLLAIVAIAVFHILASGADQFIENVFRGKGEWHQYTRDICLMIPDVMHIVVSCVVLAAHARYTGRRVVHLFPLIDIVVAVGSVLLLWALCAWL